MSKKEQRNFTGSIALSKLNHVIMIKKNKKGKKIKCLVIPIKENFLIEGKEDSVYLPLRIITKTEEDDYGQHGFISQSVDSKVYKKAKEKGGELFEKIQTLPILGNIKDWSNAGDNKKDGDGKKGEIDENDDLPF